MNRATRFVLLALYFAIAAVPYAARAQSGSAPETPAQSVPPPSSPLPCEPSGHPPSTPVSSGQKACNSDGEIQPPKTGDEGVIKPPDTGKSAPMPVISPPGSPGGNPNVRPK